jgi:hypothetical protein
MGFLVASIFVMELMGMERFSRNPHLTLKTPSSIS